jgi:mannose-6-phosphate isomerase-like protein (cupin superfamily)
MSTVKHERPPEIRGLSNEQIFDRYVKHFADTTGDWNAFADAQIDGHRRGQHRFIGGGGSGKHDDPSVIPPNHFTLSVMQMPPGQGASAHTHEIEEVLFVLDGELTVTIEDSSGKFSSRVLRKWDCIACPAGVPHGFFNTGTVDTFVQVMIGAGRPGPVGYSDDRLYAAEVERRAAFAAARENTAKRAMTGVAD